MNVAQYAGWTPEAVAASLTDRGWHQLGSGAAAFCFGKQGSGRVVKIVCGDRGQAAAMELFTDHHDVAAFPRIYSKADLCGDNCFVVEMERLKEQPLNGYANVVRYRIGRAEAMSPGPMEAVIGERAAELIRVKAAEIGEGIDLHADNLMLRKDGSVVAVDPFYVATNHKTQNAVLMSIQDRRALRAAA